MAAGMFNGVHHHKEVVAVRCEDCGAWLDYQPAEYRLKAVRKLTRQLSQRLSKADSQDKRSQNASGDPKRKANT